MKKILIIILAIIILLVGLLIININSDQGSSQGDEQTNGKLKVTASFYPLYFFAKEIGGEKAQVANLIPAGAGPHDYDPSAQDIALIQDSDLLIINGANLEPWYDKLKSELMEKNIPVVVATEGIDLLEGGHHHHHDDEHDEEAVQDIQAIGDHEEEHEESGHDLDVKEEHEHEEHEHEDEEHGEHEEMFGDPHVWLSPILAKKIVKQITKGYIQADENNAEYYSEKESNLLFKLDQLDEEYRQGLSSCEYNDIVTSHTAFTYLADEYGLSQVAISGLSPNEEPSAQELAEIVEFAKEKEIKYIFFESLVSPKLSETIANEIGAQTLVLDPIGGLSEDSISKGKNYFTVMEDNLNNLRIALSCSQ